MPREDISPASPKICPAPLIINLSSINGLVPFPLFAVYSASKHAVEALSEGLRFELLPFGIRVVLIEPGSFMTKFTDNRRSPLATSAPDSPYRKLIDNFFRRYEQLGIKARTGLLYRLTKPEQVAELIFKIAGTAKPRLRYRVGYDAQLYYWLHRLLPAGVWEWLLRRAYRW